MTDHVHPDGLPTPRRYFAILAIGIGIVMAVLDGTVVNVALPSIARQLGATPAASVWVINAYQLVIVATLLPLAALGELIGYRRVYSAGLVLFTLGSLACALSGSLPMLVAARALQGLGGSAIMSMNGALVRHTYPDTRLGRGLGLNALIVSLAAAVAPSLASGILAVGPWPWLFAVNVPFGIVNVWLAWRFLPHSERSSRRFDYLSAALNALMFGLFFVGANSISRGGGVVLAVAELAAAVLAGVLLFRRGTREAAPLIPVDLLRNPTFARSVTASVCAFATFIIAFVALPFYFQSVLGRDQVETGLLMTPWPVALGLMAPLAGWLSDRVSAGVLGGLGMVMLAVGMALLTRLSVDSGRARHRLARRPLRSRFRPLPVTQQPGDALRRPPRPVGRRRRHAGTGPAPGHDRRRDGDGADLSLRPRQGRARQPDGRNRLRHRRSDREPVAPRQAEALGARRSGRSLIRPR